MDPSTRIISHMNKDHQLALIDYLVVYGDARPNTSEFSPQITAINEKSMQISYIEQDGSRAIKTFKWDEIPDNNSTKVTSINDLKTKLVAMAKYAAGKQGYSHVTVQKYPKFTISRLFMTVVLAVLAVGCYDKTALQLIMKKDPVSGLIYGYMPTMGRKMLGYLAENIRLFTLILYSVHVGEVTFLMAPMLRRYRVGRARIAWYLACLIEGFPALFEFKRNIQE